jgi:hypothetical protein
MRKFLARPKNPGNAKIVKNRPAPPTRAANAFATHPPKCFTAGHEERTVLAKTMLGVFERVMTSYNTISTETWKVRLPEDWTKRESSIDGSVYFESSDESKGAYFTIWRIADDTRSQKEILESFRRVELRSFDEMEGRTWERVDEWTADIPLLTLGVDCLDREHSYRLVCQLIIRLPWLVRSSFHDYYCEDYDVSKEYFRPIIESLEIHHEDA